MITQEIVLKSGLMLILLGFVVVFASSLMPVQKGDVKFGVVGLFGPIPFGFGSDKKMIIVTMALAVFLIAVGYLFLQMNR